MNILCLLMVHAPLILTPEYIPWTSLTVAQGNKVKGTYLHFYSDNCPPCVKIQEFYEESGVIRELKSLNCVQIKVPSDTSIIYGVRRTPTDVWINRRWRIVGRCQPPQREFLHYIKKWKRKLK
jgi:hypothetical protein